MRFFSKLASVLTILCVFALSASAQSISYSKLGPSPTGLIGFGTYTGANPDSVMTVVKSTGLIGASPVYRATEYTSTSSGQKNITDQFQASLNLLNAYKASYNFGQGSGVGAVYHYSVLVNLVDTGLTVIGTPPGTFVVTGVIVHGNNDTTGYTSNATLKVGYTTYAEIVASATPSLGALGTAAATLVSPRNDVPANTPLYAHVTTAAVATTETCYVGVYGYIR